MSTSANRVIPLIKTFLGGEASEITNIRKPARDIKKSGAKVVDKILHLYMRPTSDDSLSQWNCTRQIPFTKSEVAICDEVMKFLSLFLGRLRDDGFGAHMATAMVNSAFDIAVARILRRRDPVRFGPIQRIIQSFKELTFERYEGVPATSGALCTPNPRRVSDRLRKRGYEFNEFVKPFLLDQEFFADPLAYRFISGTNHHYFMNRMGYVYGTLRSQSHDELDHIARLNGEQYRDILSIAGSDRAFAIRTTASSEVQIIRREGSQLVCRDNRWMAYDHQIFVDFLAPLGVSENLANELAKIAFAMSASRHGTVILVADDSKLIQAELIKSSVSGTELSHILGRRLSGRSLFELRKSGELIGALSSDGLFHLSPKGSVLSVCSIVDTSHGSSEAGGGGRTSAARAASASKFKGRVIKVSHDGPIDLFENGASLYRFG